MTETQLSDLALAVRDLIARDALSIPPYPGVATRLQQIVAGGNYGAADLVKIVSIDSALAATVLRFANSAAYQSVSKITALPEAVNRIGSTEVVKVALATSLGAEIARKGVLAELRRKVWQESLVSAVLCQLIAGARELAQSEAFTCGLLHDFGRVVAINSVEALLAKNNDKRALSEQEWLSFLDGFHVEIGLATVIRWGLSPLIQTVVSAHHEPDLAKGDRPMVDAVVASDAIAHLLVSKPVVSLDDLVSLPDLSRSEASFLLGCVPKIASFIAGIEETTPRGAGAEAKSQVLRPATQLAGEPVAIQFPAKLVRHGRDLLFQCTRATPGGLVIVGAEKLPENFLARLRIEPFGEPPFDVHANIVRCVAAAGGGHECEARLFGLSGTAKDQWLAVLKRVGASRPAAKPQ